MSPQGKLNVVGDSGQPHRDGTRSLGTIFDWRLKLTRVVDRPQILTLPQLWSLPGEEFDVNILCVSSGRICDLSRQRLPTRFAGVALQHIISLVQPSPKVQTVRFISRAPGACGPLDEPHDTALDIDYCRQDKEVILTGCFNGQPEPPRVAWRLWSALRCAVMEYSRRPAGQL